MVRQEHPNPQFERENWMNLNGEWAFAFDFGKSGMQRKWYAAEEEAKQYFTHTIQVPFCPESKLSGMEYKDFMPAVWYRRNVTIEESQLQGRVLLHFGAVDYKCQAFVNGQLVGTHIGGYSSFAFEVTDYVQAGENVITVYAEDNCRGGFQPSGKQCGGYYSEGCMYTRTTGIWQTVWLEFLPKQYVKSVKFYPDIEKSCFGIDCQVEGKGEITFTAVYAGRICGTVTGTVAGTNNRFTLPVEELHLWECGNGRLYDILITYGEDTVKSYAGMRKVQIDGYKFLLNGKPVFQRLVLDQGFYRDGIYTAPSEEALLQDIKLSMAAGFNGARLHEKMFEPRFLYHCDKEGYLVWGEHANWGMDLADPVSFLHFMPEWLEAVQRDFNHPSIIGWCPFNETWDSGGRRQNNQILANIYNMTKALDCTRPCIDTSGNFHVITDIYDIHDYNQDVESFTRTFAGFPADTKTMDNHSDRQQYTKGLPLFISEYGGIKWDTAQEDKNAWGYGEAPKTEEEFIARYRGLTNALLQHPYIMGFCYTQLYDVEQETNGLYDYDRKPKFDMNIFYEINQAKAAIEEEGKKLD